MPNPNISFPAGYATATAMAYAQPDGAAQLVSLANPLPVSATLNAGGSALSVAGEDGALVTVGAMADAAASSDAGSFSLIALTKRIVSKLGVGQKTMAQSLAVVLASDQSAVPVSGTVAVTGISTAAKQPALGTAGTASTDVLTIQGIAGAIPLKVDGSATTQPISGTVTVPETTFWNDTTANLASAASFTGVSRNVGVAAGTATASSYFNAFFFADQSGIASIECSNDGANWRTLATASLLANTPLALSMPVMTQYHRAKLVNGATAQGAVMVNSSYSGS